MERLKKQKNKLKNLIGYGLKKGQMRSYPNEINVEPTNRCNMNCTMCARHKMTRKHEDLNYDLFCKVVNECKDFIQAYKFIGIGEPLLHPRINELITKASNGGAITYLVTNGLRLDKEMSKKIIDSGLHEICISVDGPEESYNRLRKNKFYYKILDNIESFLSLRKKTFPIINVNMIIDDKSKNEADKFYKYWSPKVDNVTLKYIHNFGGNVHSCEADNYQRKHICQSPWFSVLLLSNGEVVPCCGDIDGELSYGNISNFSIKDLWNSSKASSLRKFHAKKSFQKKFICSQCDILDHSSLQGNIFSKVWNYFFSMNLQGKSSYDLEQ